MSLPRAIIPGRRYLVTRRCSERRFLMRPDRETNNAFVYCMAMAARKSQVSIVCVGTTSNHYHAVVVDNQGRLPELLDHSLKLFAKHQNCLRGRWEAFWATEQTSVVETGAYPPTRRAFGTCIGAGRGRSVRAQARLRLSRAGRLAVAARRTT
jgi:putative transposase